MIFTLKEFKLPGTWQFNANWFIHQFNFKICFAGVSLFENLRANYPQLVKKETRCNKKEIVIW